MLAVNWKQTRRSSESVWPLRGADGLTFAERKEKKEKERERQY